jgi:hypothetical protein
VIDQVRGAFGHATTDARRAESTTLARKRHRAIQSAGVTVEPREPGRETPASEKFAELLLDKPWQAFPISNRRHLRTERLEVFEDDAMEHALCRMTRLVRGRRCGHGKGQGRRRAMRRVLESGLNS